MSDGDSEKEGARDAVVGAIEAAGDSDSSLQYSGQETPVEADLKQLVAAKAAAERARRQARQKHVARPRGFEVEGGVRSRARVQELAEVFTAEREIHGMLALLGETASDIRARFLEPACGNGNFLEEIAARKLTAVTAEARSQDDFEFLIVLALSSVYGIDISQENVSQARARLKALVIHAYSTGHGTWKPRDGFYRAIDYILETNIVLGNSLDGADAIVFVEYSSPAPFKLAQRHFTLAALEAAGDQREIRPKPLRVVRARHYLELADGD